MKQLLEKIRSEMEKFDLLLVKGNSFFYLVDNVCVEIYLERSKFNLKGHNTFWFNMRGFIVPNAPLKSFSHKKLLADCYLMFIERTSVLWKNSFEQYTITSENDHETVLRDIEQFITEFLVPFCSQVNSMDDLIQFLISVDEKNNRNK
jgi:hypothetical protein